MEDIDPDLLTFPRLLEHIGTAARYASHAIYVHLYIVVLMIRLFVSLCERGARRVCQEDVLADLERQVKKLKEVKLCASRHPHLHRQMAPFLKVPPSASRPHRNLQKKKPVLFWGYFSVARRMANARRAVSLQRCDDELCQVKSSLHELAVLSLAVAEFFCEDPQNFKLEECCAIFHSFARRFVAAVQVRDVRPEMLQIHDASTGMNVMLTFKWGWGGGHIGNNALQNDASR